MGTRLISLIRAPNETGRLGITRGFLRLPNDSRRKGALAPRRLSARISNYQVKTSPIAISKELTNMQTKPYAGSRRPTNEDLNGRIKGIIATYLDLPRELVVEEASLSHDLCADSLEITEMMVFEEEFGCKIGDDAADRFLTVGDIVTHLQSLSGT